MIKNIIIGCIAATSLMSCQHYAFKSLTTGMDAVSVYDAGNFVSACGVETLIRKDESYKPIFEKAVKIIDVLIETNAVSLGEDDICSTISQELVGEYSIEQILEVVSRVRHAISAAQKNNVDWVAIAKTARAGIVNGIKLSAVPESARPIYM